MSKVKEVSRFENWDEISGAIERLHEINVLVKKAEADMNKSLGAIKAAYEDKTQDVIAEAEDLQEQVKLFTTAHKGEFTEKKSKDFAHGAVGFRASTSIITRNVKAIIEALKQHNMTDCIIRSEKIDKDVLAGYDDEALKVVGAKRKTADNYYLDIKFDEIGG